MDIADWRLKIDELDRQIVELISERARAVQAIGELKKQNTLAVYVPKRESVVFENVCAANKGPLPDSEMLHIYERLVDTMRALQQDELRSGEQERGESK